MTIARTLTTLAISGLALTASLFTTGAADAQIKLRSAPQPAAQPTAARVVIDEAPTSDDFAEMLFGAQPPAGIKMRGIVLHGSQPADPAPARVAPDVTPKIVAAPVKFAFNSADVPADFEPTLVSLADALNRPEADGKTLVIAGHTDPVGAEDYNAALSKERAQAVARFLVEQGVPSHRLVTLGKGESHLLSPTNHHLNRRVEFEAR